MVSKRALRLFFAGIIVLSFLTVTNAYVSTPAGAADFEGKTQAEIMEAPNQVAPPRENISVIATDSNSWLGSANSGPRARAELVAFNPNGSILYYNDSHTRYWDVDPVPGTRTTVEYTYANHLPKSQCPTDWNLSQWNVNRSIWNRYIQIHDKVGACTRNGIERVNLTTGSVTQIWSQVTPGKEATRYHDADRLNATNVVVADIYFDRVFIVNTKTGQVGWTWNASNAFPTNASGGPYPKDWTHINNVEVVQDDRITVSVRNHDQVVFLDSQTGLVQNWTLGSDNNHDILYEQHNPDYINATNGGPAEVVADSENNRVIEYQREYGSWSQTWTWQNPRMQWPRDADRLPNGHTLITDSNGNHVFEVNKQGQIVWSVQIAFPYEAERLGTGDESTGGPSAKKAGLDSRTSGLIDRFWISVKAVLPGKYLNGLMYLTPVWIGLPELFAIVGGGFAVLVWSVCEVWWTNVPSTVWRRLLK